MKRFVVCILYLVSFISAQGARISTLDECDQLRYSSRLSIDENVYIRDDNMTCFGMPVFRMVSRQSEIERFGSFFIHKASKNDAGIDTFWCDSFMNSLSSQTLSCAASCNDIRFRLDELLENGRAAPQLYDARFSMWTDKSTDLITCEKSRDITMASSNGNDQTLDALMNNKMRIVDRLSPSSSSSLSSSLHSDELMSSMIELLQQEERMSKNRRLFFEKQASRLRSRTTTSTTATIPTTTTTTTTMPSISLVPSSITTQVEPPEMNVSSVASSKLGSSSIGVQSRFTSCPQIEYQIFVNKSIGFALEFSSHFGAECRGYPVYKALSADLYIFRNNQGDWCQDFLSVFESGTNCALPCVQMRLGPTGIRSPIESRQAEIVELGRATSQKQRYICSSLVDCKQTAGCLNGGTCAISHLRHDSGHHKCICLPHYTGALCDILLDSCFSDPCLNGGSCMSDPYESPICVCANGYEGSMCEKRKSICDSQPCVNGGTCLEQTETVFKCACAPGFSGPLCNTPADICRGKALGELVAHPNMSDSFVTCVHGGHFKVKRCPVGLVFNAYANRCDYDDLEPDTKCSQNFCQNGGTCEHISIDQFVCNCPLGYTGVMCETNIDECLGYVCGMNGKCVDLINGLVCICGDGYYGHDCLLNKVPIPCGQKQYKNFTRFLYPFDPSVIVECAADATLRLSKCPATLYWNPVKATCGYHSSLLNGGSSSSANVETGLATTVTDVCATKGCVHGRCNLSADDDKTLVLARCVCDVGYEGELCDKRVDNCATNPCLNNGTCVNTLSGHYCICANKFIDTDCCCLAGENPCRTVTTDMRTKKDMTVRHAHPFSQEKFIVCNIEGYAQTLSCPRGLVWDVEEETCALKDEHVYEQYAQACKSVRFSSPSISKSWYPYSKLKYVQCNENSTISVLECEKETPYFNQRTRQCQQMPPMLVSNIFDAR